MNNIYLWTDIQTNNVVFNKDLDREICTAKVYLNKQVVKTAKMAQKYD